MGNARQVARRTAAGCGCGKFTAHPGQRDALAQALLEAAALMQTFEECELYVVSLSETEPDTVWVTEVFTSDAAHKASLALPETKAIIQRAMPLIAKIEPIKLLPVGGKGLRAE